MEKEDLLKIISSMSKEKPYFSMSQEYQESLIQKIINLKLKDNETINGKIKDLLSSENNTFKCKFSYYQGISELVWRFFLNDQNIDFTIDNKMLNNAGTDVDVCFQINDVNYNVEIKCPEFFEKDDKTLVGEILFRQKNYDLRPELEKLIKLFEDALSKQDKYERVTIKKNDDNKLKGYLLSCQSKFNKNDDKNCNILFLSLRNEDFKNYLFYLKNPYSGLLTANSFINNNEYNKVQLVVISNFLSVNNSESNYWDLSKCSNLIFLNSYCNYINNSNVLTFLNFLPNKNVDFCKSLGEIYEKRLTNGEPIITEEIVIGALNDILI